MLGSEENISNKELQRAKIRERYKGSDTELLEVIPGKKTADFYDEKAFSRYTLGYNRS